MRIVTVTEQSEHEPRVAITPESVAKLLAIGKTKAGGPRHTVAVEAGCGGASRFTDDDYRAAGADVSEDRAGLLASADLVLLVGPPADADTACVRAGAVVAGFLDVYRGGEAVGRLAARGASALALELMPRTTRAQAMDAISSQHSLAGYAMAVLAAGRLDRVMPMMVTPSGTLQPARVLVIGAGVAGLQAIATARRLGARVEAFDTRPATKEQVESLGGRFIEIDLGDTGEAAGGYAKALTEAQRDRQQAALAKSVARADVVITTAAVPGGRAPVVMTAAMVDSMRPGSVVIDYAASAGGNVEGTEPGSERVTANGVRLVGLMNYPALVASDASRMLAMNLFALARHVCGDTGERPALDAMLAAEDEIVRGCLVAHGGEVIGDRAREAVG